jgi:hypothetical protein
MQIRQRAAGILLLLFGISNVTFGWGPDGHRFINRNAALHMPNEMPAFFRKAADRMEYLGPEPDRWRSTLEPSLKEAGNADGRKFILGRLAKGTQQLIDLCYTAWLDSEKQPPPYKP